MTHNELKCGLLNLSVSKKDKIKSLKNAAEQYIKDHGVYAFRAIFKDEEMLSASVKHFGISFDEQNKSDTEQLDTSAFDCKIANKLLSLQKRAQRINKPFDLTFSDVKRMYKRKRCQITGEAITLELGHDNSISFERVDASKGYTKDNVVIVCAWVNKLKNELLEAPEGRFCNDYENKVKSLAKMFAFYAERV